MFERQLEDAFAKLWLALAVDLAAGHQDPWLRESAALPVEQNTLAAIEALARVRVTAGGAYDSLSGTIRTLQAAPAPRARASGATMSCSIWTTRSPPGGGHRGYRRTRAIRRPISMVRRADLARKLPLLRRQAGFRRRRRAREAGSSHCA